MAGAWDAVETPLELHLAAIEGLSITAAAKRLGVTDQCCRNWLKQHKSARRAWEHGTATRAEVTQEGKQGGSFANYVFRHLSTDMQELWELAIGDNMDGDIDYAVSAGVIAAAGDYARKRLYAHALACSNWNTNVAMQICGITYKELKRWQQHDEDFLQLMHELEWYKKNYWEQQLHNLVARQDKDAVLFVNKSINKDRGYGEQVAVQHSGTIGQHHTGAIQHEHSQLVNLGALDLPVQVLQQVMEAIERAAATAAPPQLELKGRDGEMYLLPPGVRA